MADRAAAVDADVRHEPARGVDQPRPAVGEPHPVQLRERLREVLGQQPVRGVALLPRPAVRGAVVVDGVVAAPQDPAVGERPVVVELVAGVGDPLPLRPAQRRPLRVGQRLGHQDVVVDRHDVLPQPPHRRRVGVGGDQGDPGVPAPERGRHHDAGALHRRRPASARAAAPRAGAPSRAARRPAPTGSRVPPPLRIRSPTEVRRGVDVGAHAGGVEQLDVPPRARPAAPPSAGSAAAWWGVVATRVLPASRRSASMPCSSRSSTRDRQVRPPSSARASTWSGHRASPCARPWVSESETKPPLRPVAPKPTCWRPAGRRRGAGSRALGGDRRPQPGEPGADHDQVGAWSAVQRRRSPASGRAGRASRSAGRRRRGGRRRASWHEHGGSAASHVSDTSAPRSHRSRSPAGSRAPAGRTPSRPVRGHGDDRDVPPAELGLEHPPVSTPPLPAPRAETATSSGRTTR